MGQVYQRGDIGNLVSLELQELQVCEVRQRGDVADRVDQRNRFVRFVRPASGEMSAIWLLVKFRP